MNENVAIFIVLMTAILTFGWIVTSWIRTRHAYLGARATQGSDLDTGRQIHLLSSENAGLKGQVGRLEERISVLERIVTDDGHRLNQEIEALRLTGN